MSLASLVDELDQPDSQAAEEAALALERLVGRMLAANIDTSELVALLAERVAHYQPLGRAKAMEILKAIDDPSAAPAVAQLLLFPDELTRWMACELVGRWRYEPAAHALLELRASLYVERVPLDYSSQLEVRYALNALSLRNPIVPSLLKHLPTVNDPTVDHVAWRMSDAAGIIDALTSCSQGILMLGADRFKDGRFYGVPFRPLERPEYDWLFDPTPPWEVKVALLARDRALELESVTERGDDIYVSFDWISEEDTFAELT